MEGDLKDEDRESFKVYLTSHPELKKEFNLFEKTRLVADNGIKFQDKQKLYKKSRITIVITWAIRVAAVVAIILGISSLFQTEVKTSLPTSTTQIATNKPTLVNPVEKSEPTTINKIQEPKTQEKPASQTRDKHEALPEKIKPRHEEKQAIKVIYPERDLTVPEEITPIFAQLEAETVEGQSAVSHAIKTEKINDPRNIQNIEEYLASRAKKVGNGGLMSVQRIFRVGLTVASEISGERIGYTETDGKISSIGFDSKLMAFSIPLQKK